jgi:hypothetical protein
MIIRQYRQVCHSVFLDETYTPFEFNCTSKHFCHLLLQSCQCHSSIGGPLSNKYSHKGASLFWRAHRHKWTSLKDRGIVILFLDGLTRATSYYVTLLRQILVQQSFSYFRSIAISKGLPVISMNNRQANPRTGRSTIEHDKQINFKGTARINILSLDFPDPIRPQDPAHVKELVEVFKLEGCLRHPQEHHIPATVSTDDLQRALDGAQINQNQLRASMGGEIFHLPFPDKSQVRCLHGQHRVLAGMSYLSPQDRWGYIDLYSEGTYCNGE